MKLERENITVRLTNTILDDGHWHHVNIRRNRNDVYLGIDLETNPKRARGTECQSKSHSKLSCGRCSSSILIFLFQSKAATHSYSWDLIKILKSFLAIRDMETDLLVV